MSNAYATVPIKVRVLYTRAVTATITVEMTDGITLEEAQAIAKDHAQLYVERRDGCLDEWDIISRHDWAPPGPDIVPDEAWFTIPGHGRWATNGRSAIREGHPFPPAALDRAWIVPDAKGMHSGLDVAAHLGAMLASPTNDAPAAGLEAPGGPRNTDSEWNASRRAQSAAILDGLNVRYANTASTPMAIGYDADGVPQAITALWVKL